MTPRHFFIDPKEVAYAEYEYNEFETTVSNAIHEQHKVFMYLKCGKTIDHIHGSKKDAIAFIEWLYEENEC